MEKEAIKLAIEGLNAEKLVLTEALVKLDDKFTPNINSRLREIDLEIRHLLAPVEITGTPI